MNIEKALAALDKARAEILKLKEPPKIDTKELIVKFCDTPRTQLEIRTELKLSKSVIQRHVREMAGTTLFCVGDDPAPLWCTNAKKKPVKKAVKTNAPKLTKWQKVEPWGVKK